MTNKEAVKHLSTHSSTGGSGQTTQAEHEEAKRLAIKALEALDDSAMVDKRVAIGDDDVIKRAEAIREFMTAWSIFCYGRDTCLAIISRLELIPPLPHVFTVEEMKKQYEAGYNAALAEIKEPEHVVKFEQEFLNHVHEYTPEEMEAAEERLANLPEGCKGRLLYVKPEILSVDVTSKDSQATCKSGCAYFDGFSCTKDIISPGGDPGECEGGGSGGD